MSKGLEAFNNYILPRLKPSDIVFLDVRNAIHQVEKELKRLEELEKAFDSLSKENEKVMKELSKEIEKNRAFEIIKKKKVNVSALLELDNLQQYNAYCNLAGGCKKLTIEEYELLTEVLL